jgi:hypothetical protein
LLPACFNGKQYEATLKSCVSSDGGWRTIPKVRRTIILPQVVSFASLSDHDARVTQTRLKFAAMFRIESINTCAISNG